MKKITAINSAIEESITLVKAQAKGRPLQEPDYNAAFAIELPKLLNASGVFPNVRFSGCYVHQSPKATFAGRFYNPSTCEIGDLLVLCYEKVDGEDRYNAALIQWKLLHSGSERVSGPALKQLDLYEHWPVFTIKSGGSVIQFDIQPKTVTPGAQYGLIFPPLCPSFFCRIPSENLMVLDSPSFARFLTNMMKWQTGRPVVLDGASGNMDEWSRLIDFLIKHSIKKYFTRRNIDTKAKRASKDLLRMLLYDSNTDPFVLQSTTGEGISILYFEKE